MKSFQSNVFIVTRNLLGEVVADMDGDRKALQSAGSDTKENFIAAQQAIALHRLADAMERIATSMEVAPEAIAMGVGRQVVGKVKDILPEDAVYKAANKAKDILPEKDEVVQTGKQLFNKAKKLF